MKRKLGWTLIWVLGIAVLLYVTFGNSKGSEFILVFFGTAVAEITLTVFVLMFYTHALSYGRGDTKTGISAPMIGYALLLGFLVVSGGSELLLSSPFVLGTALIGIPLLILMLWGMFVRIGQSVQIDAPADAP